MSSDQDPYDYSNSSPTYYESDSESPIAGPSTATVGDQSGYSQPHQPLDPVGNLLEVYDTEDVNYSISHGPSSSLPSTSLQDPGGGTDATYATYTNDHLPFHPFICSPFYPHSEFDFAYSQQQHVYIPHEADSYAMQALVHDAHQHPAQDIHTSQTSQDHPALVYPHSSSTQLFPPSHAEPVYPTDTRATRPTPDGLTPDGFNTATINAGAGQHSHPSPVAASSSNQTSAPGPSRPSSGSPEGKRSLPADEFFTARRVVPRQDPSGSVHSTSSDYLRHGRSQLNVYGRGPLIPQERYRTSTVSLPNVLEQLSITFNLENPDQIGIPIIDILNKTNGFARIRDRTEAFDMEKKTFTLRVLWPGYKHWSKTLAALDWKKLRGPIKRAKLAEAIATAIRDLFDKYRNERYDTDYVRWNIGPDGIQLNQICLVALHQVSKGSWQPQLCLLDTPH